jgi:hypothetical protein
VVCRQLCGGCEGCAGQSERGTCGRAKAGCWVAWSEISQCERGAGWHGLRSGVIAEGSAQSGSGSCGVAKAGSWVAAGGMQASTVLGRLDCAKRVIADGGSALGSQGETTVWGAERGRALDGVGWDKCERCAEWCGPGGDCAMVWLLRRENWAV